MKKPLIAIFSLFTVNFSLLTLHCICAAGPNTISYQGRLRESGQPVSGTRSIQFKLFDASSAGAPVFDSDPQSIYVSSGIFGYQLGSNKAAGYPNFKDLEWATSSYWLEISVGGNAMSPREQINAVPYAFMASTAASLNGSGNIQITGAGPHYIANGNVGIGTTNPTYKLFVNAELSYLDHVLLGNTDNWISDNSDVYVCKTSGLGISGAGHLLLQARSSAGNGRDIIFGTGDNLVSERLRITSTGNVGIGTTAPGYTLDVQGTANFTGQVNFNQTISSVTNSSEINKSVSLGSWVVFNEFSLTVPAGTYRVSYKTTISLGATGTGGIFGITQLATSSTAGTGRIGSSTLSGMADSSSPYPFSLTPVYYQDIFTFSNTTTLYIHGSVSAFTGSPTIAFFQLRGDILGSYSYIMAERIR